MAVRGGRANSTRTIVQHPHIEGRAVPRSSIAETQGAWRQSGRGRCRLQQTFVNRAHWAITYMAKAGLVARPTRGRVAITDLGHKALAGQPSKIDVTF
jgi:restriction endonuclease Mrr